MSRKQLDLFGQRLSLEQSLELTVQSLGVYGEGYQHWAMAFSGGKDSSALITAIAHLIRTGRVQAPRSLTVLYADTRMELLPLQLCAFALLRMLAELGIKVRVVLPALDDRFFVYIFGRGVPPPKNRFRWCTSQLKIEPMLAALSDLRNTSGEKLLMLTGVRVGESAVRDQRIALSCSRDGAECGQGWFQQATPEAIADTLAPILHWRVCHVWDWLMFDAPALGFPTSDIAEAYGGEEAEEVNARTGCVGCNLASKDTALDTLLKNERWAYLAPFKRLKPLYAELKKPQYRLRKDGSERRQDGELVKNPMRLGPLTMPARTFGLETVLDIQNTINKNAARLHRPTVDLINADELARIHELMDANTWPDRWDGMEVTGDVLLPQVISEGVVQNILPFLGE